MANELKYIDKLPKYMNGLTNLNHANSLQYQWLYEHGCTHRHRFTRHFSCFTKQYGIKERKGFLDIETSNLKANFGIMLCWCIGDDEGNIYEDYVTKEDVLSGNEDKRIVQSCIDAMREFDRIIGHFSTYFDIPYLRTRALIHKIPFPEHGELMHTDVWKMAKSKLCLHSNRQDVISESMRGKTVKTRIDNKAWRKSMLGDEKAIAEVLDHCERDVEDLVNNYNMLLPYYNETRSYI